MHKHLQRETIDPKAEVSCSLRWWYDDSSMAALNAKARTYVTEKSCVREIIVRDPAIPAAAYSALCLPKHH